MIMITPLDIENKEFKKSPFGYQADEVDRFLDELIIDYEKIYRENIELKDKVKLLNENIEYYKTIENSIQKALVLAEQTASEAKASAQSHAQLIINEAEHQASKVMMGVTHEIERQKNELHSLKNKFQAASSYYKNLLKSELELIEKATETINGVIIEEFNEPVEAKDSTLKETDNSKETEDVFSSGDDI